MPEQLFCSTIWWEGLYASFRITSSVRTSLTHQCSLGFLSYLLPEFPFLYCHKPCLLGIWIVVWLMSTFLRADAIHLPLSPISFFFSSSLSTFLITESCYVWCIVHTQKYFLNELRWNLNSQQKFYRSRNMTFIACLPLYSFPAFPCSILIMGSATAYCIFQTQLYTV